MENRENKEQYKKPVKSKKADISSYIAALLMLVPSVSVQSEDMSTQQRNTSTDRYEERYDARETVEIMAHEVLFKNGVRKTLKGLNSISQIPVGGQPIQYYRDTGKPISAESVKAMNLPDKFDISPRVVNDPVSSMVFTIGNRKFDISPDLCNIKDIYLTSDALVIETTLLFDISYDKEEKLPDLMYRLWNTPNGK